MTGEIVGISFDLNLKPLCTIRLNTNNFAEIEQLKSVGLLDIDMKKHREKRSKDANAMLWACIGEMAAALNADKWEVYDFLIKKYGVFTVVSMKKDAIEDFRKGWRVVDEGDHFFVDGIEYVDAFCYFGSSTYNTKEFSKLLEGTLSEMREMELHTPEDDEIERLIEAYGAND